MKINVMYKSRNILEKYSLLKTANAICLSKRMNGISSIRKH